MALNFPNEGLYEGYQYTGDNGVVYIYDGVKWVGHSPNLAPGSNAIINGSNVVQVDGDGNLVIPVGAIIKDSEGTRYGSDTGNYTFVNNNLNIPIVGSGEARLNAGGVAERNSVQLRTVVNGGMGGIETSEIALEGGNGGFAIEVTSHYTDGSNGSGGPTLVYAGVENVSGSAGPGFAGFIAIDPNVNNNQYVVQANSDGQIVGNVAGGSTTQYVASLGVLSSVNFETGDTFFNGISTNQSETSINGENLVSIRTNKGQITLGSHPAPGGSTHFHIMKGTPSDPMQGTDLFFGDDYNYVLLPKDNNGIQISVNDFTQSQQYWDFNADGTFYGPIEGGLQVAGWIQSLPGNDLTLGISGPGPYTVGVTAINTTGPTGIVTINLSAEPWAAEIPNGATFAVDGDPNNNLIVQTSAVGNAGEWNLSLNGLFAVTQGQTYYVTYPNPVLPNVVIRAGNAGNYTIDTNTGAFKTTTDALAGSYNLDPSNTTVIAETVLTPTVVFTTLDTRTDTVKAVVKAFFGTSNTIDTQACEMLITRKMVFVNSAWTYSAIATVYGVIHTTTDPIVTLDVKCDAQGHIQITAMKDSGMTGVNYYVQVVATEILNYD
jgi:hypothetical protein